MYTLLCPRMKVKTVYEIDLMLLKQRGIRGFIFDLDNTIVPWDSDDIHTDVVAWLKGLQAANFKICLVSNNHKRTRVHRFAQMLGVAFVCSALKPAKRGFSKALKILELKPHQVAVVGDQMFTDILGGNRMNLYTIWVDPLNDREFIGTRVTRCIERLATKRLKEKGLLK